MSTFASDTFPINDDEDAQDNEQKTAVDKSTSPGGEQKNEWKVATKTAGITPATIIAGRLKEPDKPMG